MGETVQCAASTESAILKIWEVCLERYGTLRLLKDSQNVAAVKRLGEHAQTDKRTDFESQLLFTKNL